MARIRTIKPDFWTDEKITECSLSARLFFIGCWNFADDNGNLQRSAKKLKMQIFPADAIDCEPLIQELMSHGLLSEYSVSGDKFLHIKGFTKHQVINRPSKTGLPLHTFSDYSVSTPEVISDDSGTEGKGREGKGIKTMSGEPDVSAREVIDYLNEKAGSKFQHVKANIGLVRARLNEGATVETIKAVVDAKVSEWRRDEKMSQYLRPDTLFNATKFAQYSGQIGVVGKRDWWTAAGFDSEWDATNAGCTEFNAKYFKDGHREGVAA